MKQRQYNKHVKKQKNKKASEMMSKKEYIFPVLVYMTGSAGAALLCFRQLSFCLLLWLALPVYLKLWTGRKIRERRAQRAIQFRDALSSLSASLEAGYSMERAVEAVQRDLSGIYSEQSWICMEFQTLVRAAANAVPMEEAISQFAKRSGIEDAESFAEIYMTARRSGGNLIQIIHQTVSVLSDKAEVEREIRTILTAKQLECRIMKLMPPAILLYFQIFSPDFLQFFYSGAAGRVLMLVLLSVYFVFCWLMDKMLHTHIFQEGGAA